MNTILNTTVNTRNAVIGIILVIATTLLADQGIVELIRTQTWGPTALTLITFISGLLTKFYVNDTSKSQDEFPSE